MALNLQFYGNGIDVHAWLRSYQQNFIYDDHGYWNGSLGTAGQWYAGNATYPNQPTNSQSSVILNGQNFDYEQGGFFSGDPKTLDLGKNLWQDLENDSFEQDVTLSISVDDNGNLPITNAFVYAIYGLSHGGQVDGYVLNPNVTFLGLTDYFAEQGTDQTGTAGNDILLSYSGNDTFSGGLGVDLFEWNAEYYETVGVVSDADGTVLGWGDDVINGFADGTERIIFTGFGWADSSDFITAGGSLSGSVISYYDAALDVTSTITVNFDGAGSLGWEDVLFFA